MPFSIQLWNGERYDCGQGTPVASIVFRTRTALLRTLLQTSLGFGESYADGDIVVEGELEDALTAVGPVYLDLWRPRPVVEWIQNQIGRTLARERTDIEHHYNRGNEFYEYYLDKNMQYSCGYFRTAEDSLDLAQEQKLEHTVRKLDLRPGMRLLDIGCGWGHLMFHAAERYGVECVGLTLAEKQATFIRKQARIRKLPIEVRVQNYLELDEAVKWERIVSVGMMCHVGEHNADRYYDKIKALSAPGAVSLMHCISKMKAMSGSDPFIDKYIFPGHWFFSLECETRRAAERGFNIIDIENLRLHYMLTLRHWRKNFLENYDLIKKRMGYDDRFMRIWELYFTISSAAFRWGYLNLIQMVMSNGIAESYPLTREFLYEKPKMSIEAHRRRAVTRA
jgi:cyclopropane-fatty-acyl-phospholipid synthase